MMIPPMVPLPAPGAPVSHTISLGKRRPDSPRCATRSRQTDSKIDDASFRSSSAAPAVSASSSSAWAAAAAEEEEEEEEEEAEEEEAEEEEAEEEEKK